MILGTFVKRGKKDEDWMGNVKHDTPGENLQNKTGNNGTKNPFL